MKYFGVAQLNESRMMDFAWQSRDAMAAVRAAGGTGTAYHEVPEDRAFDGDHIGRQNFMWWLDTMVDAESLAKYLAEKFVGTHYVVVVADSAFRSTAAPARKAQFTPKGVVPA